MENKYKVGLEETAVMFQKHWIFLELGRLKIRYPQLCNSQVPLHFRLQWLSCIDAAFARHLCKTSLLCHTIHTEMHILTKQSIECRINTGDRNVGSGLGGIQTTAYSDSGDGFGDKGDIQLSLLP